MKQRFPIYSLLVLLLHLLIDSTFRTTHMPCRNRILSSIAQNPNSPLKRFSYLFSHNPKYFSRFFFQDPPMPPSSVKIVAEYAKSNRSTCKTCSKKIAAKALRLGFVSRDERGFDMTRWVHSDCASFGSEPVSSAEAINGFALLEAC